MPTYILEDIEKLEFKTKCPDCGEDFQRLVCFQDGFPVKPPPITFEFSDNHEGWKYWLDHIRNNNNIMKSLTVF